MITRDHLFGAWSGLAFLLCFFLGFWPLAHFLPGHSPSLDAEAIAAIYRENANGIRLGMVMVLLAAGFYLPFNVTLATMIRRMEGGRTTFLSQMQLAGAVAASVFMTLPAIIWGIAAFRPERDPALTLLINDAAWLSLITAVPPFLVQSMPLAFAILMDRSEKPLFPRWFAYATLWGDIIYVPGLAAFFFTSGPFAWNGLFPYWLVFIAYGNWIFVTALLMIGIIRRETAATGVRTH